MNTKSILKSTLLLILFPIANTIAKNTPMESFINRVASTNTFVTVNNIWQADNNFDQSAMLQKVEKAQPLIIDYAQVAALMKQNKTAISLVVPGIGGGAYTIDLAQYDFISNDFQVHTLGANNTDALVGYTPGVYYRGVVHGIRGSVAAFSFFNNEVYGIFSIPGEGNYNLVPNTMVGKYFGGNQHYILYNDNDLKIKQFAPQCATDDLPQHNNTGARTTTTLGNNVYNNCTEVRVYEVGDYALYMTKGRSSTNVMNYLTALFNNQSTLYRNEGVPIVLKYVQIDTVTDAYQTITTASSGIFLDTFGYITQNNMHGCDAAILVSTALSSGYGALGGVAWLQSMCSAYDASQFYGPYCFCDMDNSGVVNFPTYSWDVEVITHEMGHIVGSPHTHRCCWNPPGTGTTAIDGCYTLEGSCAIPVPQYPVGGGTIMSYCHLTSDGTNFSNGFGTQPGDTVRYFLSHKFSSTCGVAYHPSTALSTANRTIYATRECTDLTTGTTYYWNDNNTASQADDTLVLMINKNGNDIGDLDDTGFTVSANTTIRHGSGTGDTMTFPAGTSASGSKTYTMRRYWSINATTQPTSAVQVMFPFTATDTSDVDGSVPGPAPLANYKMYKVNSPVSANPAVDSVRYTTEANVSIYTYSTTASTTNWSLSTVGTTNFANMMMTNLSGGGTGFYSFGKLSVENVSGNNSNINVYPNPAGNLVNIAANGVNITNIRLTDIQGQTIKKCDNTATGIITIPVNDVAPGLYFIEIQTGQEIITKKITVVR